jgi:lysyl-tRNA synthetase class 2
MIPVNSSAIRAIDHDGRTLFVQFHSGDLIYCFPGVPYAVFQQFLQAPSKGAFYHEFIRGRYP